MKRFLILLFFLILLIVLQTTILFRFNFWGVKINFVVLFIIFLNLFESEEKESGVWIALIGGLFLDLYSSYYLGVFSIGLFISALLIKIIRRRYLKFEL